jgi:hypothetical protein
VPGTGGKLLPRPRPLGDGADREGTVYVGRVFVLETKKSLSDVISDERMFVNLTQVSINDSPAVEPFVALNKQYVKTIRVLNEGDVVPAPRRLN